ncbi:uncharacterized protein LOC128268684 [Anopheles cruzii]|uniref:uncharacterized protein LOC128268684 n=1 Tax=Anopheles cruzii TaxID=68878 RepID=UPI0022EC5B93|nr:uncharacterized protein LOC128268684 [Anopheles cruzii]
MTGIFAQLSAGEPGSLSGEHPDKPQVGTGTLPPSPPAPATVLSLDDPILSDRASGGFLLLGDTPAAKRIRLRIMQLVSNALALAFIRPQYYDVVALITLFLLVNAFVISAVLLADLHYGGRILRRVLPLLKWEQLELRFSAYTGLALFVLCYALLFTHKGYGGDVWCNWVSISFTLKSALMYGAEAWHHLRHIYGGRQLVA